MDEAHDEVPSVLIDLTGVDLDSLAGLDSPVLAEALRRVRHEVEHPEEAVVGFNSSL